MKHEHLAIICCSIGAVLVLSALCLKYFVLPDIPATATWSEEEAQAWMSASQDYHRKSFDPDIEQEELDEAAAIYNAQAEKLEAAKFRRNSWPQYCQYAGYFFIAIGAGCFMYHKSKIPGSENAASVPLPPGRALLPGRLGLHVDLRIDA